MRTKKLTGDKVLEVRCFEYLIDDISSLYNATSLNSFVGIFFANLSNRQLIDSAT